MPHHNKENHTFFQREKSLEREKKMERVGEFHCHRNNAKSSSGTKIILANNLPKGTTAANGKDRAEQCAVREQDQYMPIANVIRIMRRILPSHAKISDDAKETIQECVSEYISFITGEANERCQREQRKTVTAEDVLWAMGKLGFDDYVEPLTVYLSRYRETENERTRVDPLVRRGSGDYGPPVGIVSGYGPGYQVGYFDAMGGYYGGSGGGSSSAAGFDPFPPFK